MFNYNEQLEKIITSLEKGLHQQPLFLMEKTSRVPGAPLTRNPTTLRETQEEGWGHTHLQTPE